MSDRVNKPATTIDTVIVDRAIADADSEIDLHLHGRYSCRSPACQRRSSALPVAWPTPIAHRSKGREPGLQTAEHLRKLLSGIANGKLSLALDADGKPAPVANTVQDKRRPQRLGADW
ncbi:DUF1320 domain-containing protein [Pseudomonas aeruginosa]|uniref:DUF1320 domain-containing protein n=1 Tax=Pseudomonas aeruginosa TaxID=287 RepID=UPI001F08E61A|nr:DUF1320 domain-containing protein [Pseudomonas aeruginosa]